MKKRLFAIILCVLLILSAVSCTKTGQTDITTASPDTTVEEAPGTESGEATGESTSGTVSDPADVTTSSEPQPDETTSEETKAEETTVDGTQDETTTSTEPASSMKPAIWTLTGPSGNTVTLVGTMHVLKPSDFPIPGVLADRLQASRVLAVECDTQAAESDINYQIAIMMKMYYTGGDSLKNHLSKKTYGILKRVFADYGINVDLYAGIKPWGIYSLIDTLPLGEAGFDSSEGLDSYLMTEAKQKGIEVLEVESVDFQLDMLAGQPDRLYELLFEEYENVTKEEQIESLNALHDAWASGEEMEFGEEDYTGYSESDAQILSAFYKAMYTDRNRGMADCVIDLLGKNYNSVFAVGAAHFPGGNGILKLLEKAGYTAVRIEY